MKAMRFLSVVLVGALFVLAGCGRSDQQMASDVQSKLNSDSNIQNKQLNVSADKGVVTISGNVNSDLERQAAANDASQVSGVKTVVNNLEVASASAPESAPAQNPAPTMASRAPAYSSGASRRHKPRSSESSAPNSDNEVASNSVSNVAPPASTAPVAPPPPPAPVTITVPEGTPVSVVLTDPLSTESNHVGDTFRGSLESPLTSEDGNTIAIPAGAEADGHVVAVQPSTHFSGHSLLTVQIDKVVAGGKTYEISTNQWSKQGSGRGTRTAETIGGGAGLGALIGAVVGGGKGAAIGAGAGAAAGTGVQGVTKGQPVKLPSETRLDFRLQAPITVTQTSNPPRQIVQ